MCPTTPTQTDARSATPTPLSTLFSPPYIPSLSLSSSLSPAWTDPWRCIESSIVVVAHCLLVTAAAEKARLRAPCLGCSSCICPLALLAVLTPRKPRACADGESRGVDDHDLLLLTHVPLPPIHGAASNRASPSSPMACRSPPPPKKLAYASACLGSGRRAAPWSSSSCICSLHLLALLTPRDSVLITRTHLGGEHLI